MQNFTSARRIQAPLLVFFLLFAPSLFAQNKLTMDEAIMRGRSSLAPDNLRALQWIPGTHSFTHVLGDLLVKVDAASLKTDTLRLLEGLQAAAKIAKADSFDRLPGLRWLEENKVWFTDRNKIYEFDLNGTLTIRNTYPEKASGLDIQEKTWNAAYRVDDELRVSVGQKETLVAKSESDGIVYGTSVHRDEFGIHKGTFWSPSGRYLAFYRMDESMVTPYPIYLLDSMPAQSRQIRYPFAGAKSHHVTVGIFDTRTNKNLFLDTGLPAEQYLTNIAWTPDDRHVLIAVVNREQNHMWLNLYDAATGKFVRTLFEETHDKYVEPENPAVFVPGSNTDFVWQSERDGYNHLYLYNTEGKLIRQISAGNEPVVEFSGFSQDGKQCFFQVAADQGLSRQAYAAAVYETARPRLLTPSPGVHNAMVNSTGEWLVDVFTDAVTPRRIMVAPAQDPLRRSVYFDASNPIRQYLTGQINMARLLAADSTPLNARMILPMPFNPTQKYPVIVYVYNGPHVQLITNSWLAGSELWMHRMAQEGFIVFTLDGRGSANRGLAFENATHRRLGDLEIADQLVGTDYLKSLPFVDPDRIGVFGWSYGGFMTTSLMTRPEAKGVFKCGVAGGPVIDWRMYEVMYTERYMDTPQENPEGYEKNSLFKYIDGLSGRLLMIHGSTDDVVLWQHSLRYIRECVKKGKPIDYFVYPDHPHNVRGKDRVHLFEKIERFFKDNL